MPAYNVRESDPMTVAIDPSEIRSQATVKALAAPDGSGRRLPLPLRTMLLGGLGGAGLLAFTIGAFSFFGGLADPRVRPVTVAAKMPDLKDGLPALVSDGASPAPAATVLNLPKPPAAEAAPVPAKTETGPRNAGLAAAEPVASPPPAASPVAEATGSVAQRKVAPVAPPLRAKAAPAIENAATVSGDAKPVPLIAPARTAGPLAPAKAETVRAKAIAVAALPSEADPPTPAAASKQAAQDTPDAKPAATRKPAQKVARSKAKPVAEASAEPDAAPAAAAQPEEEGFGTKINRGIKAIGGIFGQE